MLPKYLSARYSTYLPPGFTSWFKFYEAVKPYIQEDSDDLDWSQFINEMTIRSRLSHKPNYTYSVRYIQKQALDELFELRAIQTFDHDELRYLHYALQFASHSLAFDPTDEKLKGLQQKVDELYFREHQKKWDDQ